MPLYRITANDKADMHSPGKVSDYLGIAPSTLRHYARTFSKHLSASAQGRRRTYTDQDIETLANIKSLSDSGKTLDQIREILGDIVVIDDQEDQPVRSLAVIPAIIEQYESLDSKLDQLLAEVAQLREDARKPWWKHLFQNHDRKREDR